MGERYAAIDVDGVNKTFRVPKQHVNTLKERALHPFRRIEVDELHALADVSFQIFEGEFFGIVGRNGSGKSTMLKLLAGIYAADSGRIQIAGRLTPFIELGVGFNMELTALDNVVINGVMTGLSPAEAKASFDEVIAFAELEEYVDLKLKNYSSGMQVRLAFSVAIQVDADVVLIDEVLAVGDAAFQQKCFNEFHRLKDEGRTIILVTHDMTTIERFCHRALLLDHGHIVAQGEPADVGNRYLELNFEHQRGRAGDEERGQVASVRDAWVEVDGRPVDSVAHGTAFTVHALFEAHEPIERPELRLGLTTDDATVVFAASTRSMEGMHDRLEPGERVHMKVRLDNPLGAGRYYIDLGVHALGGGMLAFRGRAKDFMVHGSPEDGGLVAIPHSVELDRASAQVEVEAPR